MTPVIVAVLVLATADPLTTRIQESAVAAQALQGPLDGAWTLRGPGGDILFVFQMSDPSERSGAVRGAWRDSSDHLGEAAFTLETPRRMRLSIDGATPVVLLLVRQGKTWHGHLRSCGFVTLTRGLATPPPPV